MRHLLRVLAVLGLVSTASMGFAETLTITGRIVAYQGVATCLNNNTYWSMIIRVQKPTGLHMRFLTVNFSQPCGISPKWLAAPSTAQRYRLIRDKERDAILNEFLNCEKTSNEAAKESCSPIPAWKRTPGEEDEILPYGTKLPSYRSADLPLVPVV
jgi:hypothetical protein